MPYRTLAIPEKVAVTWWKRLWFRVFPPKPKEEIAEFWSEMTGKEACELLNNSINDDYTYVPNWRTSIIDANIKAETMVNLMVKASEIKVGMILFLPFWGELLPGTVNKIAASNIDPLDIRVYLEYSTVVEENMKPINNIYFARPDSTFEEVPDMIAPPPESLPIPS